MSNELKEKINRAVKIIRMAAGSDTIEVCFSGGKDSDVILELAKMAGVKYRAIYKNTTIDPPGTIAHCKVKSVEVWQPKETFFQLVSHKGMPTRRARFCCEYLKEYKVLDRAIQGVRRAESTARAVRYDPDDPIICREYGSKANHVNVALPILDWTDHDVAVFIQKRKIQCHPLYYDQQGRFHVERRLGCLGCPLKSDNGVGDYKRYPRMLRLMVKATQQWMDERPLLKSHDKFGSAYGLVAHNLFYHSYEAWQIANNNIFGHTNWKSVLESYFKIELP